MTSSEKRFFGFVLCIAVLVIAAILSAIGGFFLVDKLDSEQRDALIMVKSELYGAVVRGDLNEVERLLDRYPEAVNLSLSETPTEYGKSMNDDTPLIAAGNNVDMVELLLSRGADVNKPTPLTRRYPLTQVLSTDTYNRFKVAWLYINNGADVCVIDAEAGSVPNAIVSVFVQNGAENALLQLSARDIMEYAVERGASLKIESYIDYEVRSILGKAIENNLYMVVEYLILSDVCGVNDRVTNNGRTPLIEAICCYREHIVEFLLENGADPSIADYEGTNAYGYILILFDEKNLIRQTVEKFVKIEE